MSEFWDTIAAAAKSALPGLISSGAGAIGNYVTNEETLKFNREKLAVDAAIERERLKNALQQNKMQAIAAANRDRFATLMKAREGNPELTYNAGLARANLANTTGQTGMTGFANLLAAMQRPLLGGR